MVEVWWSLVGTAIPAVIAGQAIRMKKRRGEEQRLKSEGGREKSGDEIFVCERVCTSKRMLKKVGSFSKDRTPDTCVTVCGVSELDACTDACARTVCVNQHQVPNWNDICLRRCQKLNLRKGRTKALEGIDMHNLVSSSRRRPTIPAEIVAYSGDSEDRDDDKEEVDEEQDEEEDGDANKNEEDEEDRDDDSDQSSQLYLWTRMRVHSNYYVHDCMKESITWPYCYGFER